MVFQPVMIAKMGYPVETHHVQTDDGYILCLHRIKHGKHEVERGGPKKTVAPKKVVLVMHGILMSSADYVLGEENKSLGESRH